MRHFALGLTEERRSFSSGALSLRRSGHAGALECRTTTLARQRDEEAASGTLHAGGGRVGATGALTTRSACRVLTELDLGENPSTL